MKTIVPWNSREVHQITKTTQQFRCKLTLFLISGRPLLETIGYFSHKQLNIRRNSPSFNWICLIPYLSKQPTNADSAKKKNIRISGCGYHAILRVTNYNWTKYVYLISEEWFVLLTVLNEVWCRVVMHFK